MKKSIFLTIMVVGWQLISINCFAQQTKPEIKVQLGQAQISSVAFSPDGKNILSGSSDYTLALWDISTGKQIRTYTGHTGTVNSVVFSSDGKFALSGSSDATIKLWEISTGKEIKTCTGHSNVVTSVAFSFDGKNAISGSWDKALKIWEIESGKEVKPAIEHSTYVFSVAYSPNGKEAISTQDSTIKLWDLGTGKELKTFIRHKDRIWSIAFTPDGKKIISASQDKTLKLWDVSSGKEIKKYEGHSDVVKAVAFSKDGKTFISGSEDHTVKVWDLTSGKEIKTFSGHTLPVTSLSFSPDGKTFISGSEDYSIKLWDIESGREIRNFTGRGNSVYSASLSPDGRTALTTSVEKNIIVWDLYSSKVKRLLNGHTGTVLTTTFLPDGNNAISYSIDSTFKFWNLTSGNTLNTIHDPFFHNGSIKFSPDNKISISLADKNTLKFREIKTGKVIESSLSHPSVTKRNLREIIKTGIVSGRVLAFLPDGKRIVFDSNDKLLVLWDIMNDKELKSYKGHTWPIISLAISPDGKKIISCDQVETIRIWDIETGMEEKAIPINGIFALSYAFTSDSRSVFVGFWDGTIKQLNINNGDEIKVLKGHITEVNSLNISPDGKTLLSGSSDHTLKLWDIKSGNPIYTLTASKNGLDWLVYTEDGYWDSSPDGGELVAMVEGVNCWNIDQFAVRNNRPDKILERIPSSNVDLIDHYFNQYRKRLRRLGISEEELSNEYHVPSSSIIESKQNGKFIDLKIKLSDTKYKLKSYNIFINNVPLFGSYGKEIRGKTVEQLERIELVGGDNKIEVSCLNNKGAESYRALIYASNLNEVKKDLYLLAFGVSKYNNPDLNLRYADKDALDLQKVIETYKGKGFENIYTKVLINEQVTPAAIKASKDFVKNAKPDDTFILFIAGHGMHDRDAEATYYFLTSNADINNLKGTAADFETIEDLLQGIPPRNKLFLMDACESGEIDEEDQGQMIATATGAGIVSRGIKAVSSQPQPKPQPQPKRSYLYQKDRYIYNDLVRRSGAIVFSSSKGGELSYERSDIENGLFTENIMKALTTTEADKDNNGTVSTDELREYVSAQVAKASGDLQHPTVDRDNIYQKFGFQVKR
jgi:WD40 repeat protein/uncharacterized caspase-like protein